MVNGCGLRGIKVNVVLFLVLRGCMDGMELVDGNLGYGSVQ